MKASFSLDLNFFKFMDSILRSLTRRFSGFQSCTILTLLSRRNLREKLSGLISGDKIYEPLLQLSVSSTPPRQSTSIQSFGCTSSSPDSSSMFESNVFGILYDLLLIGVFAIYFDCKFKCQIGVMDSGYLFDVGRLILVYICVFNSDAFQMFVL